MTEPLKGTGWKPGKGTKPHLFRAGAVFAPQPEVSYKFHYDNGWWGDQGRTSQCVIYSHLHIAEDALITRPGPGPILDPTMLYLEGRALDGSPLDDSDGGGLTCDTGAKVMRAHGVIGEYRWVGDDPAMTTDEKLDELLDALAFAPVTCGADWPENMNYPNGEGFVSYDGQFAGLGHQWVMNGFNKNGKDDDERYIRNKNSWGRSWGRSGRFYMTFRQVKKILERPYTAICIFRELPMSNLIR